MSQSPSEQQTPITFVAFHDDDDCRTHRMYPAAWPVAADKERTIQWLIVHSGAGFDGLHLDLTSECSAPVRMQRCILRAYPFHNGQATSPHPVAALDTNLDISLPAGETQHMLRFTPLPVPFGDPEARRRVVIVLALNVTLPADASVTFHPTVAPLPIDSPALALPPVRLHACHLAWVPQSLRDADRDPGTLSQFELEEPLRLNEPAICSMTAIIPGTGEALLEALRAVAEKWIGTLSPAEALGVTIRTEKHMTAGTHVTNDLPRNNRTSVSTISAPGAGSCIRLGKACVGAISGGIVRRRRTLQSHRLTCAL